MRIAFISSAYRTIFFHALEAPLAALGHEVYWICPGGRWARWLQDRGVRQARILDLAAYGGEWSGRPVPSDEDLRLLGRLEEFGPLSINDLLQMDTLLMGRRGRTYSLRYFSVNCRNLERFLRDHQIEAIFAEQTWGIELLAGLVANALDIPFLKPHTVRFPAGRFGLFPGHSEACLAPLREPRSADAADARDALDKFVQAKPDPAYVATDREVLRFRPERLRALARHVRDLAGDPWDETSRRPVGLMADHGRQWLRKRWNLALARFRYEEGEHLLERPFVYFPLHLQPEASIDVKGRPFADQIAVVRALSRTTPVDHRLLVKEHPTALHRRDGRFYSRLREIPGVVVVSPTMPTFTIMERAALTVAITGTAAYEAALLGRLAATIAPVFFDRIVAAPRFNPFEHSVADVLTSAVPADETARVVFLADLMARSHPGVVGDAFWQPESMATENLEQVAAGFDNWSRTRDERPPEVV